MAFLDNTDDPMEEIANHLFPDLPGKEKNKAEFEPPFPEPKLEENVIYIYLEGNHGYKPPDRIYFQTDCPFDVKKMKRLTYLMPGAGRFATPFNWFAEQLEKMGYQVNVEQNFRAKDYWKFEYREIEAADGNY
jgi:hypothetical protein